MVQKVQSNGNAVGVNTGVDAHGGDLRVTRQQQVQALRSANPQIFKASRIQMLASRTQIVAPTQAVKYIGQPVSTVTNYVPLQRCRGRPATSTRIRLIIITNMAAAICTRSTVVPA